MNNRDESRDYISRTPGLKCQKCGRDISGRAASTKWCFDCSKEVAKLADREHKKYIAILEARDKVISTDNKYICPVCAKVSFEDPFFCGYCGQRLKEAVDE